MTLNLRGVLTMSIISIVHKGDQLLSMNMQVASVDFRLLLNCVLLWLKFALVALGAVRGAFCYLRTLWSIVCRRFEQIPVSVDRVFAVNGVDQPLYTDDIAIGGFLDCIN